MKKGQVSGYIFAAGAILVIGTLIFAGMTYILDIDPPWRDTTATGAEHAIKELAEAAENCWHQTEHGTQERHKHCGTVHVITEQNITEQNITEIIPEEIDLHMEEKIEENTQAETTVSYTPAENHIEISQTLTCDPAEGENCTKEVCRCPETVCQAGYEVNGQDATDIYGCVEEEFYRTNLTEEKCEYPWNCLRELECNPIMEEKDEEDPDNLRCCPPNFHYNTTIQECIEPE